jgi:7,8-dihydropterin-6-yl-methyl-4-(beta-D-ribofuranosyl)aminobenzene 5'-phosphate synthase
MKVSVVCENSVVVPMPRGLTGEHGLSLMIEDKDLTLYDTGQGFSLIKNLQLMGKNAEDIARIIISHGHYDHTGGLMPLLQERKNKLSVYAHKESFMDKIALIELPDNNIEIPIGYPHKKEEYEKNNAVFNDIEYFQSITDGISSLSDVERPENWQTWDIRLKCKEGDTIISDPFNDDASLLLETGKGPVVLLGCAHAGIVEILDDMSNKSGHKEFYAVIGGTHLGSAGNEYIQKAISSLEKYNVQIIAASHCTGFNASSILANHFKEKYMTASVGNTFEF